MSGRLARSVCFVSFASTRARSGSLWTDETASEVSGRFAFVPIRLDDDDDEPSGAIVDHGPCGEFVGLSNTSFFEGGLGLPNTELNAASSDEAEAEDDELDDMSAVDGCEEGWLVGSSVMVG